GGTRPRRRNAARAQHRLPTHGTRAGSREADARTQRPSQFAPRHVSWRAIHAVRSRERDASDGSDVEFGVVCDETKKVGLKPDTTTTDVVPDSAGPTKSRAPRITSGAGAPRRCPRSRPSRAATPAAHATPRAPTSTGSASSRLLRLPGCIRTQA